MGDRPDVRAVSTAALADHPDEGSSPPTMIVFIYGTTAEAIKLAPVIRRLRERGVSTQQWVTMQHTEALTTAMEQLGLGAPDQVIAHGAGGKPLRGSADVVRWGTSVMSWLRKNRKRIASTLPANTVIVVHGDTMTSVVGAWIAKRMGFDCAHIEAGLRSGNWRHPFPEELDRRIVGTMATVHYTPSMEATHNLRKRSNVVYTHGNTALDAVLDHGTRDTADDELYGLVLLHRFEFISNSQLVDDTLGVLGSSTVPLRLIVDAYNRETLERLVAGRGDRIQIIPKLRHDEFVAALENAAFVVTDSGGIQAETALLGVPTLIHRKTTEQGEGIGRNIVLSEWDLDRLRSFLTDYDSLRHEPNRPEHSPSDVIVADLLSRGYGD
jgi:UDP-N-acetylglucosamine 2-epimerase (non-hydrolysing)